MSREDRIFNIFRSIIIIGSIITIFVISQFNWANDHNYYEDIILRVSSAVLFGIIIGIIYLFAVKDGFKSIIKLVEKVFVVWMVFGI